MSGQRKALIIANDEYAHQSLRNLHAPAVDAEALERVLADPKIGDFSVQVVSNGSSHVIAGHIDDHFSDCKPDDLLLVHFSGHGLKSDSGELFFAASNTRPDRLGSTAVAADFLQRCMRDSRSRSVVLLLDCCYSGAFAKGIQVRAAGDINVLDSFPRQRAGGGRGRAVITASSSMEFAFEGSSPGPQASPVPSVFTSALVEGLATGEADRDGDGWISLDELYDYVFDKVREQNPHQTPSRQFELSGELYLARSPRVRPTLLPADLYGALTGQNIYARLGAMTEVRSRLSSDDMQVAMAAHAALAELSRSASPQIAQPAAKALSDVAMRPTPAEVHFGEVEQGAAPPHQVIRLLGPPISRAYAPRRSHPWIRVDRVAEGLDISIDTAGPGTLRGSIVLEGPAGPATITIDAVIRARPGSAKVQPPIGGGQEPGFGTGTSPDDPLGAKMCTACSKSSKDPVVAEDGYCLSCGRRVDADRDLMEDNRDRVEWNLGQVAGVSDKGLRRSRNEDAMDFAVVDSRDGSIVVAVVSDGVSSAPRPHEASWAATRIGAEWLAEGIYQDGDPVEVSQAAVRAAGQALVELVVPEGAPAATYVSAIVSARQVTVCWLGDSRAYWLAAKAPAPVGPNDTIDITGGSHRVTRDDSLAEEIVAAGLATMDEAMASPRAHVITRWLGADLPEPEAHIEQFTPTGPGVLLLCSRGLWNYRPEAAELAAMAMPVALTSPLDAAVDLTQFVIDQGALDNITVVLIPFPPRSETETENADEMSSKAAPTVPVSGRAAPAIPVPGPPA